MGPSWTCSDVGIFMTTSYDSFRLCLPASQMAFSILNSQHHRREQFSSLILDNDGGDRFIDSWCCYQLEGQGRYNGSLMHSEVGVATKRILERIRNVQPLTAGSLKDGGAELTVPYLNLAD